MHKCAHLFFPLVLVTIALVLTFDAFSSSGQIDHYSITRNSWFLQHSPPEVEWALALCALFVAIIWVGGRVGWWIVRTIIQWWFHRVRRDG
jgi:hypothetical protein